MKKLLVSFIALAAFLFAHTQNQANFRSIGKKQKVFTLSNGRFDESFVNNSIQQIGSVEIDVNTGHIKKLLPTGKIGSAEEDMIVGARFLSVDPLTLKYPTLSPYAFCLNNPIVFSDPDGRDAIVSIKINKDGSVMLKVQTIVHITGDVEETRLLGYNGRDNKKTYADQKVDVEGKIWNIQYDVRYIYDKTFDASKMKEGENVLFIDPNTPQTGPNRTHVNPINNKGYISKEHRKNNSIILHETGHLIGFNDKYTEIYASSADFASYLKGKYTSEEDTKPGGNLYKILSVANEQGLSVCVANEGYENNQMQNNKGGFTSDQMKDLVSKTLSVSNGKEGTFIIKGIFGERGKPTKEVLKKGYETLEKQIQTLLAAKENKKPIK